MKKIGLLCGVVLLSAVICVAAATQPYTYQEDGFEATDYNLSRDQLGTQLDPPAHWSPGYPAIDELLLLMRSSPNSDSYPRQSRSRSNYHLPSRIFKTGRSSMAEFPKGQWCLCARLV